VEGQGEMGPQASTVQPVVTHCGTTSILFLRSTGRLVAASTMTAS
jgi:hypothetical protein